MRGFCLKRNRKISKGKIKNWCAVVQCVHLMVFSAAIKKNNNERESNGFCHNGGLNSHYHRLKQP